MTSDSAEKSFTPGARPTMSRMWSSREVKRPSRPQIRAKHALVLALRVDDALLGRTRLGEERLHDEAGAEDEAVELVGVSVEVGDRPPSDAALHGRACDRRRNAQHETRIERTGDEG